MQSSSALLLIPLLSLLPMFATVNAAPGDLDPSFHGGIVITTISGIEDIGTSMALQEDGKIVVVGRSWDGRNFDFAVVRYNGDGSLDTSFGVLDPATGLHIGKVTTAIARPPAGTVGAQGADSAQRVVVQRDGKIVVAGQSFINLVGYDFSLVRYNPDGSLDDSFGAGGVATTSIGSSADPSGLGMALQGDGKIVIGGGVSYYHSPAAATYAFALLRYNTNGSLDTTFGSGGIVTSSPHNESSFYLSVAMQNDGKIVAAGLSWNGTWDPSVVRYNSDGSLDSTFGSGGQVITPVGDRKIMGRSVAVQADGKIVLVGGYLNSGGFDFALVRYNPNGSLDNEFGDRGNVITAFGFRRRDIGESMAFQKDGKIIVAGSSDFEFALARYNANGSLDTSFGSDGEVITSGTHLGTSVAIQDDGKIVVAGDAYIGRSQNAFAVVRYQGKAQVWGAKVTLTPKPGRIVGPNGGQPWTDFLVAFDGTKIITQRDLTFEVDGSVTAGDGTLLRTLARIEIVRNPTPVDPVSYAQYGFNKYIAKGVQPTVGSKLTTRTVELATRLYDGQWHIKINSVGLRDDGLAQALASTALKNLWAIPRRPGINDGDGRTNDSSVDDALAETIINVARTKHIPPQSLQAIAWHESLVPLGEEGRFAGLGWNQYGYLKLRVSGFADTQAVLDPVGQEQTLVTWDGGVGIMQITAGTALETAPVGSDNTLTHLWKLSGDIGYNVGIGADVLNKKKASRAITPMIGTGFPEFLEHWYGAVWRYNAGAIKPKGIGKAYVGDVWELLQDSSKAHGRWVSATWDDLGDELSTYETGNVLKLVGKTTFGPTQDSAHADVDFNGTVDVRLSSPSVAFAPVGGRDVLTVTVEADEGLTIHAAQATLSGGKFLPADGSSGLAVLPLTLREGTNVFASTAVGRFRRSTPTVRIMTTATFSVEVVGVEPHTASGATYRFTMPRH